MSTPDDQASAESMSRANKRRKVFRRRAESPEADVTTEYQGSDAVVTTSAAKTGESADVPKIVRQRWQTKLRRGGIEFSQTRALENDVRGQSMDTSGTPALAEEPDVVQVARDRFAPQTGTVAETDNPHMTSYVDAELERLRRRDLKQTSSLVNSRNDGRAAGTAVSDGLERAPPRQPASVGQIQEVDLGPATSARNIAMTEAAMRRLGDQAVSKEEFPLPPPGIRMGKDGKPRPTPRKNRRNSDDLARDEIVEALLRENKLDLYEPPISSAQTYSMDSLAPREQNLEDTAADDALAEQFQREYLEAMQSRREIRNKPPPGPTVGPPGANKGGEIARGPKLGGSRSARAAMHAAEKEKEKARGTGVLPGGPRPR